MREGEFLASRQNKERTLTVALKACADSYEIRADAPLGVNKQSTVSKLVEKATGADNASGVENPRDTMGEDEFLALGQKSQCLLTMVKKASVKKFTGAILSAHLDQAANNEGDTADSHETRADTPLGLNKESTCRISRLVRKATGSDLPVDLGRSLMKANNASRVVDAQMGNLGDTMGEEEVLALRQRSGCLLTLVKKAHETLGDRPPDVAVATNTASVFRWCMMCITFCSGMQKSEPGKTSRDDVVELVGPGGPIDGVAAETVCDRDKEQ